MSRRTPVLSQHARHEVLLRFIPAYQQAEPAKKSLLLDQFVEVTGYTRKYAIGLLNHPEKSKQTIQRPRLPFYGSEVQQALFLAWKATRYVCAQRLIPFLPEVIPLLERCGYLALTEEHRRQLLTMSATTARRFLRTQHKPTPHGLSTTQAGPLLKHQIPIRTFHQWDDLRPGFLEADLVAHCGGQTEGSYLYTFTLTDIATGWTECLPLRARTSSAVLIALQRARTLFPFPFLGIDTDNGAEFINEEVRKYCEQEHLTFTRGRPKQKNDQCFTGRFGSAPYSAFRSAVSKVRAFAREQEAQPDLWPLEVIHGPTLASQENWPITTPHVIVRFCGCSWKQACRCRRRARYA